MSIPASLRVVAAVVLAAAFSGGALAQEVTGSLSGSVQDQQGMIPARPSPPSTSGPGHAWT
jgi:hypothetical protein